MIILGISAYYHDSAACLISEGKIIAAAQEERFTRLKQDSNFPINAITYCLNQYNIKAEQVDYIVFYEKPFIKFERLLETYFAFAPKGFNNFRKSLPIWVKEKLFQKNLIINELEVIFKHKSNIKEKLLFSEHHLSHAASAFFPSPFSEAAVITLDGVGEWATTTISIGKNNNLNIIEEINFPHSIGLLYSAFTYYLGFQVNSGEYKVMGLAPYGKPIYADIIKDNIVDIKKDGSFFLNMDYFDFCTNLRMTSNKFHNLFGGPPRQPEAEISQKEMDIAASIQYVTEEIVLLIATYVSISTKQKNLCLAGGVALNCVANGKIIENKIFENVWIQPAAGDAGGALGAALATHYMMLNKPRKTDERNDSMFGSYLGPSYSDAEIEKELISLGGCYHKLSEQELVDQVSKFLSEGMAVGWMQGRMEFGPRALGNRSIIADPRSPYMQKQLNLKIKYRESFRPFAPSIIKEELSAWFDTKIASPYMLLVSKVKKDKLISNQDKNDISGFDTLETIRSVIPAITHVDNTARVQTVDKNTNNLFYKLIKRFSELTTVPILINTSFNVRGEPIVCNTKDAFNCFMGTELDVLIIGNYLLSKKLQDKSLLKDYKNKYKLD